MKRTTTVLLTMFVLIATALNAQTTRTSREAYIKRFAPLALSQQSQYGVPASITLAQGLLESDAGNSRLAKEGNNHFGIKCKKNWNGEAIYHDDDEANECFRAYRSAEESYLDHAEYLRSQPRYADLFKLETTDYKGWAEGLKKAGYATAPTYASSLIKLIEDYQLYLYDEDRVPDTAQQQPTTEPSTARYYDYNGGVDIDTYTVALNSVGGFGIYSNNNSRYVVAGQGDNLRSISKALGVSSIQLRKVNDLKRGEDVKAGDMVYIDRKASAWTGQQTIYDAVKGDTMHSVSQRFGIRLKSLNRLNPALSKRELSEKDEVRLM